MRNEELNGPWQQTRCGIIVPARGVLLLPTPKDGPSPRRAPGRVVGPASPIARRPERSISRRASQ